MKAWLVKEHLFVVADLEAEDPAALTFNLGIIPSMAYTDPPWNKGVARLFRTKARKSRPVEITNLLAFVAHAHRYVMGDAWIEFAPDNSLMLEMMKSQGWHEVCTIKTTYEKGGRPESLALFTRGLRAAPPYPEDYDSPALPAYAVRWSSDPGDYVLDATTGYGCTTKAALTAGRRFVGYELNEERLERAIKFAEKHEREERVRVH